MKKNLLLLLFCCCTILGYAQLKLGIKGGVSTTNLSPSDLNILGEGGIDRLELAFKDAKYGVHASLVFRAQIGRLLIQPEVTFNSNSVDFELTDLTSPGLVTDIKNEKYQNLDIPLLVGTKFGPLRVQAGPEMHVFIDSSSELFDVSGYEQKFKDATFGWLLGLGLDIWNFMLDIRYEGNFTNFGTHITFNGVNYEFDESPSRFLFSVGVFF